MHLSALAFDVRHLFSIRVAFLNEVCVICLFELLNLAQYIMCIL